MPPKGPTPWLTAEETVNLLSTAAPSKLGQELARGVDPNQLLEVPTLDSLIVPRAALREQFREVPEQVRSYFRQGLREELLPPPGPNHSACAAEVEAQWGWDTSWDDCVPGSAGESPKSGSRSTSANAAGGSSLGAADGRWSLLLVACLIGHSPLQVDRLLKAGADPNVVHRRTGATALMCLVLNDTMGIAAKKEAVQILAKHRFNRWGAVRRDACMDAVTIVVLNMVDEQQMARRVMTTRGSPAAGPAGAAGAGGGGGRGGGGVSVAAQALARCQRKVQEGLELLEELLRRRAWPPVRGCPSYVSKPLLAQMAFTLVMLDATALRVLELMTGPYAGTTGLGRGTQSLHLLVAMMMDAAKYKVADNEGQVPTMSRAVLLRRLVTAGVRPEEPFTTTALLLRNLLEPGIFLCPEVLGEALEAGMPAGLLPSFTAAPMTSPHWKSLVAEAIAEGYPRQLLETLLRGGADPRAPVLGCIRPLTLATLACDTAAYDALLRAGAPRSDAPSPPSAASEQYSSSYFKPRLLGLVRQPLRTATEPLLSSHFGWLVHAMPGELLNLLPLLSSPCRVNALTLLALLHCVNSRRLREVGADVLAQHGRRSFQEDGDTEGRDRGEGPRLLAVDLGSSVALVGEYMQENPTSPYIPYVLSTFPFALRFVLDNTKLLRLLAAPVVAVADRLDPPSARIRAAIAASSRGGNRTQADGAAISESGGEAAVGRDCDSGGRGSSSSSCSPATQSGSSTTDSDSSLTLTSNSTGRDSTGSGGGGGDGNGNGGQTDALGPAAAAAAAATASANTVRNINAQQLLLQAPEWPSEQELPYEVLRSIVFLPRCIDLGVCHGMKEDQIRSVARRLWNSEYPSALVRISSAILRTEALAPTGEPVPGDTPPGAPTDGQGPKARPASGTADGNPPSYSPGGAATPSTCRWRLLTIIFASTMRGLGMGAGVYLVGAPMPPLKWVPYTVLMLNNDPWVRALVANETFDAIAQATHQTAAEAEAAAAEAEARSAGADTAHVGAAWEAAAERLAGSVEPTLRQAVYGMSYGFSCPLSPWIGDVWASEHVASTLAARRDAAAAGGLRGVAAQQQQSSRPPSAVGEGRGSKKGKKAATAAGAAGQPGAGAKAPTEALTYEPYGSLLAVVPHWVQMAVTQCVWDILRDLHSLIQEHGALPLSRALLAARARLGPPLG